MGLIMPGPFLTHDVGVPKGKNGHADHVIVPAGGLFSPYQKII
jgi:hypothetical protein